MDDGHLTKRMSSGPDIGAGGALRHSSSRYNSENSDDFGSFGSLSSDVINQSSVHFEESAHSFGPPTHAFAHSSMIYGGDELQSGTNLRAHHAENHRGSVIHYADAGLSMELRGLLNRSSLVDPYYASEHSFTGSLVPIDESSMSILDIRSDQQVRRTCPVFMFVVSELSIPQLDRRPSLYCSSTFGWIATILVTRVKDNIFQSKAMTKVLWLETCIQISVQ